MYCDILMMMMMLDYVILLVEYVIISVPILSQKNNYYIFMPRIANLLVAVVVVIVIYIYIYTYIRLQFVCDTILSMMVSCCVGMDAIVSTLLSIVCWVSSYLQRIMTTRLFTIPVHLLVVVLINDC